VRTRKGEGGKKGSRLVCPLGRATTISPFKRRGEKGKRTKGASSIKKIERESPLTLSRRVGRECTKRRGISGEERAEGKIGILFAFGKGSDPTLRKERERKSQKKIRRKSVCGVAKRLGWQ